MIKHWLLLLFVVGSRVVMAQETDTDTPFVCAYKCDITFKKLIASCPQAQSLLNTVPLASSDVNPYKEFRSVIDLLSSMDSSKPFPLIYSFKACETVCNAASVTIGGLKYIYYNQRFLNGINGNDERQKWAIRCIIAHEIGHHVLGHTDPKYKVSSPEQQRKNELRADHFSAFVIQHYPGATLENAFEGLNALDSSAYEPKTETAERFKGYPTLDRRYSVAREGFTKLNNPITLSMYNDIDSVANRILKEKGLSQIFHVINELMFSNKVEEARSKLEELKAVQAEFYNKIILQDTKHLIEKQQQLLSKEKVKGINDLSPGAYKELIDLQSNVMEKYRQQLKKENYLNKIELKKLNNKVNENQKNKQW